MSLRSLATSFLLLFASVSLAQTAGVTVKIHDDPSEIPDDFWAHGQAGDVLMRNGKASLVFGGVPDDATKGNAARQGSALDLFVSPADPENFQLFQPTVDSRASGRSFEFDKMTFDPVSGADSGRVTFSGKSMTEPGITVDSTYEMQKAWPGVLVSTTVTNTTDTEQTLDCLGDYLAFGSMVPFLSGSGYLAETGTVPECEFLFARRYDASIAVVPTSGRFDFVKNSQFGVAIYKRDVKLAPGAATTYKRWLLTGLNDPGALVSFAFGMRPPTEYGTLAGRVSEMVKMEDGRVQDQGIVPNAEVRLSVIKRPDLPKDYQFKPYILATTNENGEYRINVPTGEYIAFAATPSRFASKSGLSVDIVPGKITSRDIPVSVASSITYEVYNAKSGETMPAKLSFVALRGTQEPDLGPPGRLESGTSAYSATGRGIVQIPPGDYRVIASRGPEFQTQEKRVRVAEMRNQDLRFDLDPSFETPGWVSADIGVMTDASPHSRVAPRDRVKSSLGEGLEWIVTGDINVATDLQPTIDLLTLGNLIHATPGIRFVSGGRHFRGDFLVFPADKNPIKDIDSVLATTTPLDTLAAIRSEAPDALVIAERAVFPSAGQMTFYGYDLNTGNFPLDADFHLDGVDAMAVTEGKRQSINQAWMNAYFVALATSKKAGDRIVPIGGSLSTGTYGEEPGYPRIYVKSSSDDPANLNVDELVKNVRDGKLQVTNGPFIEVTANGKGVGELVQAKDGKVDVDLHVYTPNWASVSNVSINLNGAFSRRFVYPAGSTNPDIAQVHPKPGSEDGASVSTITVTEDSILQIVVEGDPALPQDPVNPLVITYSDPNLPTGQSSYAFTAPIYIDFDGDGKCTPDLSNFLARKAAPDTTDVPF